MQAITVELVFHVSSKVLRSTCKGDKLNAKGNVAFRSNPLLLPVGSDALVGFISVGGF